MLKEQIALYTIKQIKLAFFCHWNYFVIVLFVRSAHRLAKEGLSQMVQSARLNHSSKLNYKQILKRFSCIQFVITLALLNTGLSQLFAQAFRIEKKLSKFGMAP